MRGQEGDAKISVFQRPVQGFTRQEGDHGFIAEGNLFRLGGWHALQFDEVFVERQAIEAWAVERAESLEVLQCAELFEDRCVSRDGIRRIEAAGTAAAGLFAMLEVRRGVGAEEETVRAAGNRLSR